MSMLCIYSKHCVCRPLLYSIAYGVIGGTRTLHPFHTTSMSVGLMAYIIMGVCTFPFYFFFPDWFDDRTSWQTEDEIHHDGALAFEVVHKSAVS